MKAYQVIHLDLGYYQTHIATYEDREEAYAAAKELAELHAYGNQIHEEIISDNPIIIRWDAICNVENLPLAGMFEIDIILKKS